MRIAIVGTPGSLRTPVAASAAKYFGMRHITIPAEDIAAQAGLARPIRGCPPSSAFKAIDDVMQAHLESARNNPTGMFDTTSIELLAYYLYACSETESPEQTRNVIKNCLDFLPNYSKVFVVANFKDLHEDSGSVFGGNVAFEYCLEYIMWGIVERFGINHYRVQEPNLEMCVARVVEILMP